MGSAHTVGHRMIRATKWFAERIRSYPHICFAPITINPADVNEEFGTCCSAEIMPGMRIYGFRHPHERNAFVRVCGAKGARFATARDPIPTNAAP